MTKIVTPTIHINGTDGRELLFEIQRVMASLAQARDALRLAMPNARDYYPQGGDAYSEARKAFGERWNALSLMLDEFEALALAINAQIDARNERGAA